MLRGARSDSTVRSQVWRGRPARSFQSLYLQCRWTWNTGNRCQKVWDTFQRVCKKRFVNHQAQLVLDHLSDWQPVQLSKSWSHTVTRLEIQNGAWRCVSAWKLEDRPARRCNSPDATRQVLQQVSLKQNFIWINPYGSRIKCGRNALHNKAKNAWRKSRHVQHIQYVAQVVQ